MNSGGYMAIPPGAILPESLPEFKIFMRNREGKYVLWAADGNRVTVAQLAKLSESGVQDVFVDIEESFKYEQYLEANLGKILDNQGITVDRKAAIFSRVSTNVVKAAFETSLKSGAMGMETLQRTQKMIENAMKFITDSNSLPALAKMIGHDYETYEHAMKVTWWTVAFISENPEILTYCQKDEISDAEQISETLRSCGVCALLHDIGKAYVPQEVINKNGPLTEIEWEIMKRHPLSGLAMLLDSELPAFVKKAIVQHHEDFDGGGYPMNLEGTNITVLARVLRIMDVFDAMTSRRPYKDPLPPMKAIQIMIGTPSHPEDNAEPAQDLRDRGMGRCFDHELLGKFIIFIGNVKLD